MQKHMPHITARSHSLALSHTHRLMLLPLPLHLCTCALSQGCARSLSLTARSFSVGVAALRPAFFVFAKHVNFCVYFLIFVCASMRCFCFLAACCWRRCRRLLLQCFCFCTALCLLCRCLLCLCLRLCLLFCIAFSFIASKRVGRGVGERGESYGNCFSWHLLSQAIGSLQPFVLTAFSCVGLWKLAQNMPQLGIPRQLCSCCGESSSSSVLFSFSPLLLLLLLLYIFGTSVAFCICSLCVCVFYICLNHVKSCMLIVRLVSQLPQRKGKKL